MLYIKLVFAIFIIVIASAIIGLIMDFVLAVSYLIKKHKLNNYRKKHKIVKKNKNLLDIKTLL